MSNDYDLYTIKPGDTLFRIMAEHYGRDQFVHNKDKLLERVKAENPHISDVDLIYANTPLVLPVLRPGQPADSAPKASSAQQAANAMTCQRIMNQPPMNREVLSSLQSADDATRFLENAGMGLDGLSGAYSGLGKLANLARDQYTRTTKDIQFTQALMKQDKLTKASYYGDRSQRLGKLDQRFSLIRNKLGQELTPTGKLMRVSQNSVRHTKSLDKSLKFADGLSKRAKYAGKGFAALSVGLGAARYMAEDDARERSSILLETAGSMALGGIASIAIGAALVSNPVGWGVIVGSVLITGAAGYAGGEIGGAIGDALHDEYGSKDKDIFQGLFD